MPEAKANMAYTRFVLEAGMAGDLLERSEQPYSYS